VEGEIGLYSSYGWHSIRVDASIATIKYLQQQREELFRSTENLSSLFKKGISEKDFGKEAEIRIKGAVRN